MRKATGSCPARVASSSIRHSTAKAVWVEPTERHHWTGTAELGRVQLGLDVGDGVGQVGGALHRGLVHLVDDQHLLEGGPGDDGLADDAVVPGAWARPWASSPARRRCRNRGRYQPPRMSSSRVHCSLIGVLPPAALKISAASVTIVGMGVGAAPEGAAGVEHVDADLRRAPGPGPRPSPPGRRSGTARR